MREYMVCPATLDHAMALMPHVRSQDRSEWVAGTGDPTRLRLAAAVTDPKGFARAVFVSGVDFPLLIWGASQPGEDPGEGQAWLIATDEAVKHAISLHSLMASELPILDGTFQRVVAYADKRNTVHHRWLRWLGFECLKEIPMGPWGLPFKQFERSMTDVRSSPRSFGGRASSRRLDGGGE